MKKYLLLALSALLVVLFSLSNICVASAAMRNLLLEFYGATGIFVYGKYIDSGMEGLSRDIDYQNKLKQVDDLIKQGLHAQDAMERICYLALNISNLAKEKEFNKAEAFCVALIKRLTKAKADFKEILGDKFLGKEEILAYGQRKPRPANSLTNNLLKAFLDAGAEPHYYLLYEVLKNSPYNQNSNWNAQKAKWLLERAKILVDHKVKTVWDGSDFQQVVILLWQCF